MLTKGKWYGASSITAEPESYYCLSDMAFSIHEGHIRATVFPTKLIHPMTKAVPRSLIIPEARTTRSGSGAMRSTVLKGAILAFCRSFPGVAILLGGPGKRASSADLCPYFDKNCQMLKVKSCDIDCAQAAVVNGVAILLGFESQKRATAVFQKKKSRVTKLGQMGPIINKMGLNLQLCRPKPLARLFQKGRYWQAYSIIAGFTSGLWLVDLVHYGSKRVDHCVLVNCDARVILDFEE